MKNFDDMGMKENLADMLATHCALDYDDLSGGNCTKQIDCADCLANDILKLVEIDQFGKWIPVTERLPEDGENVLCYMVYGDDDFINITDNIWFGEACGWEFDGKRVTHWMPLPQPPKEGE